MPELPAPKAWPHPKNVHPKREAIPRSAISIHPYAELAVASNFTFLCGASHSDELMQQAAVLGYRAIAITDRNSLAGIVRAHVAAKEIGMPLAIGCRLELANWKHNQAFSREPRGERCFDATLASV